MVVVTTSFSGWDDKDRRKHSTSLDTQTRSFDLSPAVFSFSLCFSLPGHSSLSRPKSLLVSSPSTKLLTLEEAQARTQAQINSPIVADSKYIEVGEGPAALQGKFHTVIDFPSERYRRLSFPASIINFILIITTANTCWYSLRLVVREVFLPVFHLLWTIWGLGLTQLCGRLSSATERLCHSLLFSRVIIKCIKPCCMWCICTSHAHRCVNRANTWKHGGFPDLRTNCL